MEIYNDRINILKNKISSLSSSNYFNKNKPKKENNPLPLTPNNYEIKYNDLKLLYENSIKTLELKYKTLKEHLNKLNEIFEENCNKDEEITNEMIDNIHSLETIFADKLREDDYNLENNINNVTSISKGNIIQIDNNIINLNEEIKEYIKDNISLYSKDIDAIKSKLNLEKNEYNRTINELKDEISEHLTEINNNDNNNKNEDELLINNQYDKMKNLIINTENFCADERRKRDDFKMSINAMMNETIMNLNQVNKFE
jgi:hypothetical protein